jgi:uncharacterized protein YigE (DUF2233 family)
MRARCFVLFWLLACSVRVNGAWTIVSSDELGSRAAVRHIRVTAENGTEQAQLHLAVCDLRQTTFRMIDQPNEPRATLAEAMQRSGALAGVNGGYFDQDFGPVGLLVTGGRFVAPKRKARLLSGILSVSNGRVRLQRSADFSTAGKVSEAVQCGPFLLERRRAVAGLDNTRAARRTFAGLNGNRFVLGFCSPVTLAELAKILAALSADPASAMERALNLDGGSSSAFWVATGETPFSIAGFKQVRDFVAVVRRETADQ